MMTALNRFSNLVYQAWKCRTAISFFNLLKLCLKMRFGKNGTLFSIRLKKYPHPIFLRARTTDCVLFAYIFLFDGGEYPVFKDYAPKFIIDAGANIGLATVFFKHYYPDTTVVAIEPENRNCEMFRKNTAHCKDVHLIQGGLGPDENKFMRVQNENDAFYSFRLEESADGIPEITINRILAQYRPEKIDILKIDIESGEKALFTRNTDWIARVDNIFIELHDFLEEGCSKAVLSVVKGDFFLRTKGENYLFTRDYLFESADV
jgi:FkbM family methyltransferase